MRLAITICLLPWEIAAGFWLGYSHPHIASALVVVAVVSIMSIAEVARAKT